LVCWEREQSRTNKKKNERKRGRENEREAMDETPAQELRNKRRKWRSGDGKAPWIYKQKNGARAREYDAVD